MFLFVAFLNGWFFLFPTFCLETKPTYAKACASAKASATRGRWARVSQKFKPIQNASFFKVKGRFC
jgi:hypothetical protein